MSYEALADRRLEILGELAELGLVMARDLQVSALAAEDTGEKVRYAEAFHRISRSVRQSLALHARLVRDGKRERAEDEVEVIRLDEVRTRRRKAHVRARIEQLLWTEREHLEEEPDELLDSLDLILDSEAEMEGFSAEPVDDQVARLWEALGLSPPAGPQGPCHPHVAGAGSSGAPPPPSG